MSDTPLNLRSGEFATRAQTALPVLSETDRRVIEFVLASPDLVISSSATELARTIGVSQSSVVRSCQRIGYAGYQDVKLAVARDLARAQHDDARLAHEEGIDSTTPAHQVLDRILRRSALALSDASATIDPENFARAVKHIVSAARLLVIGNGTSAAPAYDAAYRFSMMGINTSGPADTISQHMAAAQLSASDVCMVVSHTGVTRETLQTALAAKSAGSHVVAITSYRDSPLTQIADTTLVAGGPEHGFRLEAMSSRMAHLSVIDALFVATAVQRPGASDALDLMAEVTATHSL